MSNDTGWRSSSAASRVRNVMRRVAAKVVTEMRPPYRYGTVESLDMESLTCYVLFPGDPASVPVKLYLKRPEVGDVVRVDGMTGDRYVDDIVANPGGGSGIAGEWEELAALPFALIGASVVVKGDDVYLIGGFRDGAAEAAVLKYDSTSGTLTELAALPTPVALPSVVLSLDEQYIYALGGFEGTVLEGEFDTWVSSAFQRYSIADDEWFTEEDTILPAFAGMLIDEPADEGEVSLLYVNGNTTVGEDDTQAYRFSGPIGAGTWEEVVGLNTPFETVNFGGNLMADSLWHFGSTQLEGPGAEQPNTQFTYDGAAFADSAEAPFTMVQPVLFSTYAGGRGGRYLYKIGGVDLAIEGAADVCYRYDVLTGAWSQIDTLPGGRYLPSVAVTATQGVYVFGGIIEMAETPTGVASVYRLTE